MFKCIYPFDEFQILQSVYYDENSMPTFYIQPSFFADNSSRILRWNTYGFAVRLNPLNLIMQKTSFLNKATTMTLLLVL